MRPMTPRSRWWLLASGPGLVILVAGIAMGVSGNVPAAILGVGSGTLITLQPRLQVLMYRSGFWRGRLSMMSSPRPVSEDQNPWDPPPARPSWLDKDVEP
jgi:hypothetical protein